jgi:hypothetical protein
MAYLGKTPSQAVRSRYYFTATGGETSLSGTDDNSNTLTFTDGNYVDVALNGVTLVAGTDYNTTTANTIGGLTALVASDVVEVIVYDTFSVFGGNMAANLNFKDSVKANFGTDNDLQIYHDTNNSIIKDAGSGHLKLLGTEFYVQNSAATKNAIRALDGGSVTLYYDNAAKLATTATGVDVTGTVTADGLTVAGDAVFEPDNDGVRITGTNYATLRLEENDTTDLNTTMFNSGGKFSIFTSSDDRASGTERVTLDHSTGLVGIGTASPSGAKLEIFTGSTSTDGLKINRFGSGVYYSTLRQDSHGLAIRVGDGSTIAERVAITPNGITFNGDTAAANALDDYEEGLLSLGVSSGTAGFTFVRYTKVGNVCTLGFLVNAFTDTSSSNIVSITGLPFTAASNTQAMGSTIITSVNSGRENFVSYINQNSSTLNFYASGNNSSYVAVTHAMLSSSTQIFQSITYQTA